MRLVLLLGLMWWFGLYAHHYGFRAESAMPDFTHPWLEHCSGPLHILLNTGEPGRSLLKCQSHRPGSEFHYILEPIGEPL